MLDNARFLLQIAVILGISHLTASMLRRFGQAHVVGEMLAGLVLGPSLLGALAPNVFHFLFPADSLGFLKALSQMGVVIFTFLIGVRVDFRELWNQGKTAIIISNISVILPLMMGTALGQYLFPRYGSGDRAVFSLFIGTAMSVTAFPVLSRILMERGLLDTRLGSIAVACAAVDDITAWTLLAVIVALTRGDRNVHEPGLMLAYLVIYLSMMLTLGYILSAWSKHFDESKLPLNTMLVFFILALVSSAVAERIGVHALVGAFIGGLITPRKFRQQLIDRLEGATLLLLIPIFFVLTGIQTNLRFGVGGYAYLDLLLILLVAVGSKWGGAMIGARLQRMSWRDSCQLGLLLNTRGLVELVLLNVGLDIGILTPALFSMMVCMAVATTCMATPLMDWVGAKVQVAHAGYRTPERLGIDSGPWFAAALIQGIKYLIFLSRSR